jgi:hypothetical protein
VCPQLPCDMVIVGIAGLDDEMVQPVLDLEHGGTDQSPAVVADEDCAREPESVSA